MDIDFSGDATSVKDVSRIICWERSPPFHSFLSHIDNNYSNSPLSSSKKEELFKVQSSPFHFFAIQFSISRRLLCEYRGEADACIVSTALEGHWGNSPMPFCVVLCFLQFFQSIIPWEPGIASLVKCAILYTVAGTPLKSRGKNNVPVSIVYLPTLFKLNNSRGKTNSPGSRGFQLLAFWLYFL